MKKTFKLGSVLAVALSIGLTSGCSCSLKQDKIDEMVVSIKNTSLDFHEDNMVDYTYTYTDTYTDPTDNTVRTHKVIVKRDVDNDKFLYQSESKLKRGEEEEIELSSYKYVIYKENGYVYLLDLNTPNAVPALTEFQTTYYAHVNNFDLIDSAGLHENYYNYSTKLYDTYKTVPMNACSSEVKDDYQKDLPDIAPNVGEQVTCNAEKKAFKKEYTYTVQYIVSISQTATITINLGEDLRISNMRREDLIARNGNMHNQVREFSVSYDNVTIE